MNFCTIIAKNYVAYARVLANSIRRHHPDANVWTLIIDDFDGYIDPAHEPFEVLTPREIGCPEFLQMALRYSVLELSTAVKPWLLRHLMRLTGQPVTYLDPDIEVLGSLSELDELARAHGVVLTPHNLHPIPADGRKPSQVDVMIAGIYNLGYLSIGPRPETESLLEWWSERLRRDCRVDPVWGYFVDQRWFDLVPGFLPDLAILREPQYNVAYWNLASRPIEHNGERYTVLGKPIAFFHFSGFDPSQPLHLSRHQNRIDVTEHPALERLLSEYAGAVRRSGFRVSRHWPYGYSRLGDGTNPDPLFRELYDEFAQGWPGGAAEAPSPFEMAGVEQFERWAGEQDPTAPPGVNRALARLYATRPELRGAHPDVAGDDLPGLLAWAQGSGRREIPLLARLAGDPAAADRLARAQALTPSVGRSEEPGPGTGGDPAEVIPPAGVNVAGCAAGGEESAGVARLLVRGLDAAGIPALPIDPPGRGPEPTVPQGFRGGSVQDSPFSVNVLCGDARGLGELLFEQGAALRDGRYSVGVWLDALADPRGRAAETISMLDELWVPSRFLLDLLEPQVSLPVTLMPMPLAPMTPPAATRAAPWPESRDGMRFLTTFDYRGGFDRQNPLAAVEAFTRAFGGSREATLLLACTGAEVDPENHKRLLDVAASQSGVAVAEIPGGAAARQQVIQDCDCYVSLHRAEAFGLALAEAMWFAKPVVATGFSGNLEFMTPACSLLVDHELVALPGTGEPARFWAQPDLGHAAACLRRVLEDRAEGARLGAAAAAAVHRSHGPERAAEVMARRLASIRVSGPPRSPVDVVRRRPAVLAALPSRVERGVVGGARASGGREVLRRLVLRLMKPFTDYQQKLNRELVQAMNAVFDSGLELRREHARELAELLRDFRELSARVPLTTPDAAPEDRWTLLEQPVETAAAGERLNPGERGRAEDRAEAS